MKRWLICGSVLLLAISVLGFTQLGGDRQKQSPVKSTPVPRDSVPMEAYLGATESTDSAAPSNSSAGAAKLDQARLVSVLGAGVACQRANRFSEQQRFYENSLEGENPMPPLTSQALALWKEAEKKCRSEPAARKADLEEIAIRAAQLGSAKAATCYVSSALKPSRRHGEAPPVDNRYRQLVPGFIEQGIKAGDWTMVGLAASINGPRRAGSSFVRLPPPDSKLAYMYLKLLELGAEGDEKLDLQLLLLQNAGELGDAERFDAESQAVQIFNSYFSRSGPYRHGAVCEGLE